MPEQLANKGYFAIKKQSAKATAVIPNVYIPLYDESFATDVALDEDNPIIGNKAARFQTLLGMRNHQGEATLLAEPNTAGYLFDMFLTKGSTTGSDPYTHPFTASLTTDPNAYTIDIQKGRVVERYFGCEISEIEPDFDDNKMVLKPKFSALGSFIAREIASVSTATITLKTNYDPAPTTGLVAGDIMTIYDVSAGTYENLTVSSLTATTIVFTASPTGVADGDIVFIRAATPSLSLKTPFLWTRTEFRFGVDITAALSAAQTRVEQGSKWTLKHMFESDEGSQRSGAYDPASLVRTQVDYEVELKQFFDTPEDMNRFLTNAEKVMIIRHFSETGYELRITLNSAKFQEHPVPMKSGEILYAEGKLIGQYDATDAAMFDVKVLNAVATI